MESLYDSDRQPLDFGRLIRRQWGTMLLTFLAGIAVTLAYFAAAPRVFRSAAKLFVRMWRESVTLDPTATTGQVVAAADSRESEVNAVVELLGSRALAEKMVDQFGPTAILEMDPEKKSPSLGQRLAWLDAYNLNPLRVYSLRDVAPANPR
jgi:polysaccharide biosynthesis protein PslE